MYKPSTWRHIMLIDLIFWALFMYLNFGKDIALYIVITSLLPFWFSQLWQRALLDSLHVAVLLLLTLTPDAVYYYIAIPIYSMLLAITNNMVLRKKWINVYNVIYFMLLSMYSVYILRDNALLSLMIACTIFSVIAGINLLNPLINHHSSMADKELRMFKANRDISTGILRNMIAKELTLNQVLALAGIPVDIDNELVINPEDLIFKLSILKQVISIDKWTLQRRYNRLAVRLKPEWFLSDTLFMLNNIGEWKDEYFEITI